MAEWLKAVDCKFTNVYFHRFESYFFQWNAIRFFRLVIRTLLFQSENVSLILTRNTGCFKHKLGYSQEVRH